MAAEDVNEIVPPAQRVSPVGCVPKVNVPQVVPEMTMFFARNTRFVVGASQAYSRMVSVVPAVTTTDSPLCAKVASVVAGAKLLPICVLEVKPLVE